MHDGHWETAESLFANALDISASDDRAHAGLAESLWQRGERDAAVQHLEQAVRLSAGDPKYVLRLGHMYLKSGRLREANEQSISALQAERNSAEVWALRGDCMLASGNQEEALAAYHRALALRPDYPKAQLQAAEIYHAQQRHDRLLATVDRLQENVGIDEVPARADMLRGFAMRELGRGSEAERCFARAAEKQPDSPEPHLQLASLALQEKDMATARASLSRALELDPESVRTGGSLNAELLSRLGGGVPQVADQASPKAGGMRR